MSDSSIKIGSREVGTHVPPFIIAEMSGNHKGELERAMQIADVAADAGAHAVKLQTYTADTMTLDVREGDFMIADDAGLWAGRSLYDLYQEASTPWEWHKPIFDRVRSRDVAAFSSPFDLSAIEFLEGLDVPCYKIASLENTDHILIREVARTGKPVIISTGTASIGEISEAVEVMYATGNTQLILLKCTTAYPASPTESNLRTIPHLRSLFGCEVGLSDHTLGNGAAIAAVAMGATVIEKHLTLSRDDGAVDSAFSMEGNDLELLVRDSEVAWQSLGGIHYGVTDSELATRKFRRSLFIAESMQAGERISERFIKAVRPGTGLPVKYFDQILGRRVKSDVAPGTPISWDLLD